MKPARDITLNHPLRATLEGVAHRYREGLWAAQTPQGFGRALLVEAFDKAGDTDVTDDASLVTALGRPCALVMGDSRNIKVTSPEDLAIAEVLISRGLPG